MSSRGTKISQIVNMTFTARNNSPKKVSISLELVASVNATAEGGPERRDREIAKTS